MQQDTVVNVSKALIHSGKYHWKIIINDFSSISLSFALSDLLYCSGLVQYRKCFGICHLASMWKWETCPEDTASHITVNTEVRCRLGPDIPLPRPCSVPHLTTYSVLLLSCAEPTREHIGRGQILTLCLSRRTPRSTHQHTVSKPQVLLPFFHRPTVREVRSGLVARLHGAVQDALPQRDDASGERWRGCPRVQRQVLSRQGVHRWGVAPWALGHRLPRQLGRSRKDPLQRLAFKVTYSTDRAVILTHWVIQNDPCPLARSKLRLPKILDHTWLHSIYPDTFAHNKVSQEIIAHLGNLWTRLLGAGGGGGTLLV